MSRLKKIAENNNEYDVMKSLLEDLNGEIAAIEQYKNHIAYIDNVEIKDKLTEIMQEEEHHVDEIAELISKYYGDQVKHEDN